MQEKGEEKLTEAETQRYCRQLILPDFGLKSQLTLKRKSVLILGAGGICSSAAFYLAGAGFGQIGIIDADKVEVSNLHRQIIHTTEREGMPKAKSAVLALKSFNPLVTYESYEEEFSPENAIEMVSKYDIVLDATDNAKTHYLANDACVIAKKPLVAGTAIRWDGQITVFGYEADAACYRCLFPVPTPPQLMEGCSDSGVLGVIPGLVGQLEALEAVKIALGREGVLSKRMLLFDGKESKFREVRLRSRKKDCAVCGENPSLLATKSFDYSSFCPSFCEYMETISIPPEENISVKELDALLQNQEEKKSYCFIDVRPTLAYEYSKISEDFQNIPMALFGGRVEELKCRNKRIVVSCNAGNNSRRALLKLKEAGVKGVLNVEGGIRAFKDLVKPDLEVI